MGKIIHCLDHHVNYLDDLDGLFTPCEKRQEEGGTEGG